MPSWMGGLVIKYVLDWLLKTITSLIVSYKKWNETKAENRNQAAQDMKKAKDLKPDATAKETDEAIDESLSHL